MYPNANLSVNVLPDNAQFDLCALIFGMIDAINRHVNAIIALKVERKDK